MPDGTGPAGGPRYSVPGPRTAAPSARRRRRTRSVSGPVGVLSVGTCPGLTARSCSSGLNTVVPAADPPTPLGIGLAAVLPEHFSGSSPGSRPPGIPGGDPSSPVPIPSGSGSHRRVRRDGHPESSFGDRQPLGEKSPRIDGISTVEGAGVHRTIHRLHLLRPVGRKWSGPPGERLGPWFIRGCSLAGSSGTWRTWRDHIGW